jgi:hypothetical protein
LALSPKTSPVHSNPIADAGYPLLQETIQIDAELPLGSIIASDPVTGIGSLVTAAEIRLRLL